DIVQDVFIRLWEKKAEYDKIPDFRTFLYVAVRNLCYNYLRDKKKTIDF
ncbi:MAG TPA: RNA polymerase sigma-70 factor, partial [Odoribacter splanchnicus]|nr:RNA polymerase sigma-70 factor [Odoribacter splanchnicus]